MGDIELQAFAERLKELRTSLNLTQVQFVEGLGITPAALSAYEKNSKNPSISVAKRIAEKYKISIDWLCGLSDKKTGESIISDMSDIISMLFKISNEIDIFLTYDDSSYYSEIHFDTKDMALFMSRWTKMKDLFDKNMIDNDVYNLWKEKEILNFRNKLIYKNRTNELFMETIPFTNDDTEGFIIPDDTEGFK